MNTGVRLVGFVCMGQLLLAATLWARTMYVSDTFEIVVRSEKEISGSNIIKILPTGTPVEVVEMDDSWATLTLPDGRRGYALKRYLISRLPYKVTAEQLQTEVEQQREQVTVLQQQVADLQGKYQDLQRLNAERESRFTKVTQEYQTLREGASQYLELKTNHNDLLRAHGELQQQYTDLNDAHLVLKKSRNVMWFLSGGGVMLVGWIIGMITERFRGRRRRQSSYSYQLPLN